MSAIRSLIRANTVEARKLIERTKGDGASADPSTVTDGWDFRQADWLELHVVLSDGATEAKLTPWWWSALCEQWFEGDQVTISRDSIVKVERRGGPRVAVVVDEVSGATNDAAVQVWGATSFDGYLGEHA